MGEPKPGPEGSPLDEAVVLMRIVALYREAMGLEPAVIQELDEALAEVANACERFRAGIH